MDSLSLRLKFREHIRSRAIEQVKKSRREVLHREHMQEQEQESLQQLYQTVLNSSHRVWEEGGDYLQFLREALNWEEAHRWKHAMPDILLNLIKWYQHSHSATPSLVSSLATDHNNSLILLIQCIALIYYETSIPFLELTRRALALVFEEYNRHISGDQQHKLIRIRCLIALENITSCEGPIVQACVQLQVLDRLDQAMEDFPTSNREKVSILGIYGNLIRGHLLAQDSPTADYLPALLLKCYEENTDLQVLAKVTDILTSIVQEGRCDTSHLIYNNQAVLGQLLQAQCYVDRAEQLVSCCLECVLDQQQQQARITANMDIVPSMQELLQCLAGKYGNDVLKPHEVARAYLLLALLKTKHQPECDAHVMMETMTRTLFNFWVNHNHEDSNAYFQLHLLSFLKLLSLHPSTIKSLHCCAHNTENNNISAPTWQLLEQFLVGVRLEEPQQIHDFLSALESQYLLQLMAPHAREALLQKVEGCRYGQDEMLTGLAERVLAQYDCHRGEGM